MSKIKNIYLDLKEMPKQWYNIAADLPGTINPPLGPDGQPIGPEALAPVFPMNLIEQEVSTQRWIDIPEKVMEMLSIWRPAPLVRAYALEAALDTPARIYYKNESISPAPFTKSLMIAAYIDMSVLGNCIRIYSVGICERYKQ